MRSLLLAAALACPTAAAAKTTVVDRCHVRLEPDAPSDQAKLMTSLAARFAGATITLDFTGTLVEKLVFQTPLAAPGAPDRTAVATRFVEAHRDVLNIDRAIGLAFDERAVGRRGETRYALTARFDHRGAHRVLTLLINGKGEINSVDNHGVTPDFAICAAPAMKPDDPRVVARVIGRNGWRMTADGKRVPFRVTKPDSVSAQLQRVIRREGGPHEWFRGYQVVVDALGTSYFVDGETGEVIE